MRIAPQVVLTSEQRAKLETYARGRSTQARVVLRARIVLLAGEGKQDLKIAHLLSIVPRTAARWRSRFLHDGIAGLEHDAPRPGRTPSISPELVRMVIAKTTQELIVERKRLGNHREKATEALMLSDPHCLS